MLGFTMYVVKKNNLSDEQLFDIDYDTYDEDKETFLTIEESYQTLKRIH